MHRDIIPDIHGQSEKLRGALARLGYRERNGAWRPDRSDRRCLFLGDFIDRGPDNAGVLSIVRGMIEAETAVAIMGNHEINAIWYHSLHTRTGKPLRARTRKNTHQHACFLEEFPIGAARSHDAIAWMRSLPLFMEREHFRAVHACWDDGAIETLYILLRHNGHALPGCNRVRPDESPNAFKQRGSFSVKRSMAALRACDGAFLDALL